MILSITLVFLCGLCNAFADTLAHHYDTSIFKKMNPNFWNPNIIQKTGPKLFNYPIDAWHLFGSMEVTCWLFLAVTHHTSHNWFNDVFLGGLIYNGTFNLFYNKILRRK